MAWWTTDVDDLLSLTHAGALAEVRVDGARGVVLEPLERAVAVAHPVPGSARDWRVLVWLTGRPVDGPVAWLAVEVLLADRIAPDAAVTVDGPAPDRPAARRVFEVVEALSAAQMTLFALDTAAERAVLGLRTARLTERVPGLHVAHAGGAAPFQARGTWNGLPWHFRFRHGVASLGVGGDDPVTAPLWSAQALLGDDFDAHVPLEDFEAVFVEVAARLGRAPFRYTFGVLVDPQARLPYPVPAALTGYGHTPAQAHAAAVRHAAAAGLLVDVDPEPLTRDPRVYPPADPVLLVDGAALPIREVEHDARQGGPG